MENIKVSKYVIIESDILMNKKITNTDKILYGWISVLSNNNSSQCFASNKYLSRLMNITSRQLRRSLSNLKKYNYISVKIIDNHKRIITTRLDEFLEERKKINDELQLYDYNWLEED